MCKCISKTENCSSQLSGEQEKSIQISHSCMAQTKNTPISIPGIWWSIVPQGLVLTYSIQPSAECLRLANRNFKLAVIEHKCKQMTRYEEAWLNIPSWTCSFKAFGEAAVVKPNRDGEFGGRWVTWILNYSESHSGIICFQIFNPKTGRIIESRDIQYSVDKLNVLHHLLHLLILLIKKRMWWEVILNTTM